MSYTNPCIPNYIFYINIWFNLNFRIFPSLKHTNKFSKLRSSTDSDMRYINNILSLFIRILFIYTAHIAVRAMSRTQGRRKYHNIGGEGGIGSQGHF
jgi:hypothetical protein